MKLKKENGRRFSWDGVEGIAYNEASAFPHFSVALLTTTKSHGKIKNRVSEILYYVVEGQGEFYLKGTWIQVEKDDVMYIPKNTPFDFRATKGKLKLHITHIPAYKPENEEKVT